MRDLLDMNTDLLDKRTQNYMNHIAIVLQILRNKQYTNISANENTNPVYHGQIITNKSYMWLNSLFITNTKFSSKRKDVNSERKKKGKATGFTRTCPLDLDSSNKWIC